MLDLVILDDIIKVNLLRKYHFFNRTEMIFSGIVGEYLQGYELVNKLEIVILLKYPKEHYVGISYYDSKIVETFEYENISFNISVYDILYFLKNFYTMKKIDLFQICNVPSNLILKISNEYLKLKDLSRELLSQNIIEENINQLRNQLKSCINNKDTMFLAKTITTVLELQDLVIYKGLIKYPLYNISYVNNFIKNKIPYEAVLNDTEVLLDEIEKNYEENISKTNLNSYEINNYLINIL